MAGQQISTQTERRKYPRRARSSEQARAAAAGAWTDEARAARAIRQLIAVAPAVTAEQAEQLRPILARFAQGEA